VTPHLGKGIAFVTGAIALAAGQDAILKWLTGDYAIMQILLIRGVVVAGVAVAVLSMEGGIAGLRTARPLDHAARCVLNIVTVTLFVTGLSILPLADMMAIVMASPLFTLALSVVLLRERVRWRQWAACAAGLVGVIVILRPSGGAFNLGGLAALSASACYSLFVIQTRRLTRTEKTGTMMFYPSMTVLVVAGILAPTEWVPPQALDVGLMLGAGLLIGISHYCFVQGYRYATPAVLAPIDYTALIWGLVFGWAVWHEVPDGVTLLGALLVVVSGVYVLRPERSPVAVSKGD
jgi:drug/metabolite transporter (DMT)-like permease